MAKFIAFDVAKKTGFAVFDDEKLLAYGSHVFEFSTIEGWRQWKQFILEVAIKHNVEFVLYEEPYCNPRQMNAVMTLLRYIGGLIMVTVTELNLPIYSVSIFDVRRLFCGTSKARKEILQARIKKYINMPDLKDKDACDAIGVGICFNLLKKETDK